jgi:hypothetical protein
MIVVTEDEKQLEEVDEYPSRWWQAEAFNDWTDDEIVGNRRDDFCSKGDCLEISFHKIITYNT